MRIYISGPMTGKPDLNEPLFRSTEERLRGMGHTVFNPCNLPKALSALGYRGAMQADLAWICEHADALVVLPGWDSPGALATGSLRLRRKAARGDLDLARSWRRHSR